MMGVRYASPRSAGPVRGEDLMVSGVARSYSDGEAIFAQGDGATEMYVIRSGKVRIFREQSGKQTALATLKPGDFFGEMGMLEGQPRSASAEAVGTTEVVAIGRDEFRGMAGDPLVWEVLKKMSARIRDVDDALEKLSLQDTVRREHLASLPIRRDLYF